MRRRKTFAVHAFIRVLSITAFIAVLTFIFTLFALVFVKSRDHLNVHFLTDSPKGFPLGSEGGIFPAIMGSIGFTWVACVLSTFLSFMTAVYLQFYCSNGKYKQLMRVVIGMLAGIPSIILGLFGYSFLVVRLGFGISILSGGLVLGLMVFPYMTIRFERIFTAIADRYEAGSYAMGVNTVYYILHVVLPLAWRDMVSTMSFVSGMAMGASAPLLLTGAVFYAKAPKSLLSPAMALPLHLYHLLSESISLENAFASAAVLLLILILLNVLTWLFGYYGDEKWMS